MLKPTRQSLELIQHYNDVALVFMDLARSSLDGFALEFFLKQLKVGNSEIGEIKIFLDLPSKGKVEESDEKSRKKRKESSPKSKKNKDDRDWPTK